MRVILTIFSPDDIMWITICINAQPDRQVMVFV
jgi:hypothetical protein